MTWILVILIVVVTGIIIYQDFRTRSIHWFTIPALAALLVVLRMGAEDNAWTDGIMNAGFIGLQLIGVTLYFSIRKRSWHNPVNTLIGLGDILYLLVLAVAFSNINFILFVTTGLCFALVFQLAKTILKPTADKSVPLAALLGIWFIIFNLASLRLPGHSIFSDQYFYMELL